MSKLNKALRDYIVNPNSDLYNFNLGNEYFELGQYSAAISFYLRSAEFTIDNLLVYTSLLQIANGITKQGNRNASVTGVLLRAISVLPNRPEAYFLLSNHYEQRSEWHECYALASIGEKLETTLTPLVIDVGYPGTYGFIYEKAISSWYIGLYSESLYLHRTLNTSYKMLDKYKDIIAYNWERIKETWKNPLLYEDSLHFELRLKFSRSDKIERNYSQVYQDIFVLTMLDGKREGRFVEVGCGDPVLNNNTILLEKEFGWTGIAIDILLEKTDKFNRERPTKTICTDATILNYSDILDKGDYDYLQLDCEPAINTFKTLLRIPFDTHKFAVITFEHDKYIDENKEIQEKAKDYLESYGYIRVVNNISEDKFSPFEDWWVHPDLVSEDRINKMLLINDSIKKADDYMLNRIK
jgi:tetratricopeptide (TPR) repeat protein